MNHHKLPLYLRLTMLVSLVFMIVHVCLGATPRELYPELPLFLCAGVVSVVHAIRAIVRRNRLLKARAIINARYASF